jgi:hypothetical protein
MNTHLKTAYRIALFLSLSTLPVCVSPLFGADAIVAPTADTPQAVGTVPVPPNMSKADVKESIVAAFLGRQWTVREVTADHVVGYLKHRGREAILTVNYSETQADLLCLGWKIDDSGVRKEFDLPTGWITNIKKDLTKDLKVRSAKQ